MLHAAHSSQCFIYSILTKILWDSFSPCLHMRKLRHSKLSNFPKILQLVCDRVRIRLRQAWSRFLILRYSATSFNPHRKPRRLVLLSHFHFTNKVTEASWDPLTGPTVSEWQERSQGDIFPFPKLMHLWSVYTEASENHPEFRLNEEWHCILSKFVRHDGGRRSMIPRLSRTCRASSMKKWASIRFSIILSIILRNFGLI